MMLEAQREFGDVVELIKTARNSALRAVNQHLIELYWAIGKHISERIAMAKWGSGVVEQLADYIARTEPDLRGFSSKNLWRMKQFYETYADYPILSPMVRELGWTHNIIILSRTKTIEEKEFYLRLSLRERYTKRELERQINSAVYERTMLADAKLSPALREISGVFRDSYVFEFLGLTEQFSESELQAGLVRQMKRFVSELGHDFLFVGQEYRLQVGATDFYVDLLFYHRGLQCLVAIELKTDRFKPEYLGQLNFYLEALDRDVRRSNENPSIGILLCKDKDSEVVEYALNRSLSPAMVAEYQLQLPDKELLQRKLHELFELTGD